MRLPLADLDYVLTRGHGVWEELRGARLFVTGGTGFFGKWLVESLLGAHDRLGLGLHLTVLSRNPEVFAARMPHLAEHPALTLWPGDVRRFAFPTGTYSHVIHAATEASVSFNLEHPLEMLSTTTEGTARALELAARAGARRFLLTSSGAVYGRQPTATTHLSEDYPGAPDPCDGRSAYGEGKRVSELMTVLHGRAHGFETVVARCFAFVGPHLPLDAHFAVGNFLRDALAGGPIVVGGDGTPYRSYMYAADLVVWLLALLVKGQSGRAYNVGSEEDMSIAEVARRVAAVAGPGLSVEIRQTPTPGVPPERYVPSTQRAQIELGLPAPLGLDEGLRRTLEWLRALD